MFSVVEIFTSDWRSAFVSQRCIFQGIETLSKCFVSMCFLMLNRWPSFPQIWQIKAIFPSEALFPLFSIKDLTFASSSSLWSGPKSWTDNALCWLNPELTKSVSKSIKVLRWTFYLSLRWCWNVSFTSMFRTLDPTSPTLTPNIYFDAPHKCLCICSTCCPILVYGHFGANALTNKTLDQRH